jgi:hypothetical protein
MKIEVVSEGALKDDALHYERACPPRHALAGYRRCALLRM